MIVFLAYGVEHTRFGCHTLTQAQCLRTTLQTKQRQRVFAGVSKQLPGACSKDSRRGRTGRCLVAASISNPAPVSGELPQSLKQIVGMFQVMGASVLCHL
jgi:hypothetical protein